MASHGKRAAIPSSRPAPGSSTTMVSSPGRRWPGSGARSQRWTAIDADFRRCRNGGGSSARVRARSFRADGRRFRSFALRIARPSGAAAILAAAAGRSRQRFQRSSALTISSSMRFLPHVVVVPEGQGQSRRHRSRRPGTKSLHRPRRPSNPAGSGTLWRSLPDPRPSREGPGRCWGYRRSSDRQRARSAPFPSGRTEAPCSSRGRPPPFPRASVPSAARTVAPSSPSSSARVNTP